MFLVIQCGDIFRVLAILNSAQIYLEKRVCGLKHENAESSRPPVFIWKMRIVNTRRRLGLSFCPFLGGSQLQMRNSGNS